MNLSFPKDDPTNSVVVNRADERPLYEINTPWKWKDYTTTIRRADSAGLSQQGQILAQIFWHGIHPTIVNFLGKEMRLDDFLRKTGRFWSTSKIVTGNDGKEYKWKYHASDKFTLTDCQTSVMVAESHRSRLGIFSDRQKLRIDIMEQGLQNIDVIVVSYVIMEQKQRELEAAAASS